VPDEAALRGACARLDGAGVKYAAFREPDRGGELTAVATEPVFGRQRALFRQFRLLQEPGAHGPRQSPRRDGDSARTA
jgi:hypothetical protein